MISTLRGKVQHKFAGTVIIDVGGVGYQLMMSTNSFARLPAKGEEVLFHTYLHVREDALLLFGFNSLTEKELFMKLITVSSIGPKVALSVLSHIGTDDLMRAIAVADADLIATIPGIGKKTAQRLVLELKDKLVGTDFESRAQISTPQIMEARDALVKLGYTAQEANLALKGCGKELEVEECLKVALRNLSG